MDDYDEQCRYAIFDDLEGGLIRLAGWKGWMGGQHQFVTTDKYKKKRTIYWGRSSIYISNTNPLLDRGKERTV